MYVGISTTYLNVSNLHGQKKEIEMYHQSKPFYDPPLRLLEKSIFLIVLNLSAVVKKTPHFFTEKHP
jgi:hypothetical protein